MNLGRSVFREEHRRCSHRRWDNDVDQMSAACKTHHGVPSWMSVAHSCMGLSQSSMFRRAYDSSTPPTPVLNRYMSPPYCSLLPMTLLRQCITLALVAGVEHKNDSKNREWEGVVTVCFCVLYSPHRILGRKPFLEFCPFPEFSQM